MSDAIRMMIVEPKDTIVLSNIFYGRETFTAGEKYVAYKCTNIPDGDDNIYVLPHYNSNPRWIVDRHFMCHVDKFIVIDSEDVDHDDVMRHGIEDHANFEEGE